MSTADAMGTAGTGVGTATTAEKVDEQRVLAGRLGEFAGRWVAVRGSEVVADDPTLDGLRQQVAGKDVDRIFRVPRRKVRLVL